MMSIPLPACKSLWKSLPSLIENVHKHWMWTVALYNSLLWNHHMGGPKRNWQILIECPPDTEIFSKRRKICTWCVEGMSWWQQVPSAGLNFQDDRSLSLTVGVDVSFETKAQYQLWYLDRVGPDTKLTFTWHRFSAFWLRSKCSICSYQLNIWYEGHVPSSILNWFL